MENKKYKASRNDMFHSVDNLITLLHSFEIMYDLERDGFFMDFIDRLRNLKNE